jgi:hypothetical protein
MSNWQSAYNNLEDLKAWFFANEKPLWALYGSIDENGNRLRASKILENLSTRDMEESWQLLESNILSLSSRGGQYTVRVDNHSSFKVPSTAKLVLSVERHGSSINGSSSIPAGYIPSSEVEQKVSQALELYDLKRKNEDLEAALEDAQMGSGIGRLVNKVLDHDKLENILELVLLRFLGPQVQVSGVKESTHQEAVDEGNVEMVFSQAFTQIEQVFPDVAGFMAALGNWIEANPQMAKSLFAQMQPPVNEA